MHTDTSLSSFSKKLIVGLFFLAIIGLPISLLRIYETGFQPVYGLHILITIAIILMCFFREIVHSSVIIIFSCIVFLSLSVGGMFNFGLVSPFLVFANVSALIITVAYGVRAGLFYMLAFFIFVSFVAYLHVNGVLISPVDLNVYAVSYNSWATISFSGVISGVVLLVAVGSMQKQLRDKIRELKIEKEKAEHFANHDKLTGLASLRLSQDRVEVAISLAARTNNKVALLFIDLDGFKYINDNGGHDSGDIVLIQIANRISGTVRESDTTCRVGGDEFLVVLPDIDDTNKVETLCARLLKEIERPIECDGVKQTVSASIGISIYPDDADDFKSLMKSADMAMYRVKGSGKGSYGFVLENKIEKDFA